MRINLKFGVYLNFNEIKKIFGVKEKKLTNILMDIFMIYTLIKWYQFHKKISISVICPHIIPKNI